MSDLRLLRRALPGALLAAVCLGLTVPAPAWAEPPEPLKVRAHTLEHRATDEVIEQVRPLLSPRGTVEEQPQQRTLVIRDTAASIDEILALLESLDNPPRSLRFDIQVIRAGIEPPPTQHSVISPAQLQPPEADLPEELIERLRNFLRYEDFRILARAGVSSKEGEEVTYSLGDEYEVSFRLGNVLAEQRLKLESFRIREKIPQSANKGRRLEPRDLFHATLNVWLDRPFTLVLAQDGLRQEALMVAISCSPDDASGDASDEDGERREP